MKKNAIFCGLTTVDIQYFVDSFPAPNQKVKTAPPNIVVGGPAANAAITYSFLGGKGLLVTGIGLNHFSKFIISDVEQHQVDLIDLAANESFMPIIASIVTNQTNSERAVISHFPQKLKLNKKLFQGIDFNEFNLVMVDGFYPEVALYVCKMARECSIPVVLDGGSWKPKSDELLSYIDIALCSEDFMPPGCNSSTDVIDFLENIGIQKLAITRGNNDILTSLHGKRGTIPVKPTQAIDSLGAGDVFHGAFSWFYSENPSFEFALEKAAITASFSTKYHGTRDWMKNFCNLSE